MADDQQDQGQSKFATMFALTTKDVYALVPVAYGPGTEGDGE
jgi:hypothetical protein